ncbi:MAG: hypothetical protein R3F39_24530 [Myxococcota bacterium]
MPAHDERDYAFARQFELPRSSPCLDGQRRTVRVRLDRRGAMASGPYDA